MSATKADAMTPMGMENFPRFQGPGRKRFPTKKTRMKMGIVKALVVSSALRSNVGGRAKLTQTQQWRRWRTALQWPILRQR